MISVRRFEQLSARAGRPQEQINPWVDNCDVLVAVIHRRWGASSGEGEHTGFSEEFFRGVERYERTGQPVISLHFKAVDAESEADPGAQLEQVLAFRQRIETEHVALYKRFESLDEFRLSVTQLLLEQMHSKSHSIRVAIGEPEGSASSGEDGANRSERALAVRGTGISDVLQAFADVIRDPEHKSVLDLDRLLLFATSVSRDDELPGTHLMNRIYQRRDNLKLSDWERYAGFLAYVSDHGRASSRTDRTTPFALISGRRWLEEKLVERVKSLVSLDVGHVRRGYLRLLAAHKLRPNQLWNVERETSQETFEMWRALSDAGLETEIVSYWAAMGSDEDAPFASQLAASDQQALAKLGKALQPLFDHELEADALVDLDPKLLLDQRVIARLGGEPMNRISDATLRDLARRTYLDDRIRIAAFREIAVRDIWSTDLVDVLLAEDPASILDQSWKDEMRSLLFQSSRAETVSFLVVEVKKRAESSPLLFARMAAQNSALRDELVKILPNYLNKPGDAAVHFTLYASDPGYRADAMRMIDGTFEPTNSLILGLLENGAEDSIIEFVRERDITTALTYLARSQKIMPKSAVNLLRAKTSEPGTFRYDLMNVLEGIAEDQDIPLLLDKTKYRWRENPQQLAELLKRAKLTRLRTLLDDDESMFALTALRELQRRDRVPAQRKLRSLLRHSDESVRIAALDALAPKITDLTKFIDNYVHAESTYYYNVVCELDRLAAGVPSTS